MSRRAHSAITGRFVRSSTARRHPSTTVVVSDGSKARGYRSASTGKFVSKSTAQRHPRTTIQEG
jgi:hypothetical protein